MARSRLRENQILDEDLLTEGEHSNLVHYFRDLGDVDSLFGNAGKYLRVDALASGIEYVETTGSGSWDKHLDDNEKIYFGTDDDAEMYFDGSKTLISGSTIALIGGKVGINEDSPSRLLQITDADKQGGGTLGLKVSSNATDDIFGMICLGNTTDDSLVLIRGLADGAADAGKLIIYTEPTGGAAEQSMIIDSNGVVSIPRQPGCLVSISSDQSIPTDTWTKVDWNQESYDTGNNYNTSTKRFVAPVDGKYSISVLVLFMLTDNTRGRVLMYINGASVDYLGWVTSAGTNSNAASSAYIADLDANDYIETYVIHNTGVDKDVKSGSWMCVHKIA